MIRFTYESASIYLTLWDDDIEKVNEEDTLRIVNGYVKLFRGSIWLNIGRLGSFKILEESPISDVSTENNQSDMQYEQERPYSRGFRR